MFIYSKIYNSSKTIPLIKILYIYISIYLSIYIPTIPQNRVSPNHPFIDGFSIINHPAMGDSPFMETPYGHHHVIINHHE
jgi:hypothetical protein